MSETTWKLLANGAAVVAAVVARKALTSSWEATTGTEPPKNPADPRTDWREALAWGLLTGAVIGVARMLASREAARVAQRLTGSLPDDAVRQPA